MTDKQPDLKTAEQAQFENILLQNTKLNAEIQEKFRTLDIQIAKMQAETTLTRIQQFTVPFVAGGVVVGAFVAVLTFLVG